MLSPAHMLPSGVSASFPSRVQALVLFPLSCCPQALVLSPPPVLSLDVIAYSILYLDVDVI